MRKKHANYTCAEHSWKRHGHRRRCCARCGATKTVRPRRRGRKGKRTGSTVFVAYLRRSVGSLRARAATAGIGREAARRSAARGATSFLRSARWFKIPAGPLVLAADAFVARAEGRIVCVHLLLLRAVGSDEAVIAPPVFTRGRAERVFVVWAVKMYNYALRRAER